MSGYNKEYAQDRKKWLYEHKMCIDCKSQDAFTLMGKKRCADCIEKARKRRSGREVHRDYWLEMGLCMVCGNPNDNGEKCCQKCHERFVSMSREAHKFHGQGRNTDHDSNPKMPRSEWVKNGFCYICGDKKQDGIKVCENCHQRLIKQRMEQKEKGKDALIRYEIELSCRVNIAKREARRKELQEIRDRRKYESI